MKLRICGLLAIAAFAVACSIGSAQTLAQNAYITNSGDGTVSVIDTVTNTVIATIAVGAQPFGVAVAPDRSKVYITNNAGNSVSVIDTATNTVVATILVQENSPIGVAVTPDGGKAYVANQSSESVTIIDTATNTVTGRIFVGDFHLATGVAVTPDGTKVYVTSLNPGGPSSVAGAVSVIDTATNTVVTALPGPSGEAGIAPFGVAVTPDGSKVYVANRFSNSISVINTATNALAATIPIPLGGGDPIGVAVAPDGSKVYVTIAAAGLVAVIDTTTNAMTATIQVGGIPFGLAVTPDGSKVYIANNLSNTVSVIATATNAVTATIPVGLNPVAFGVFIQPAPKFAGTPGKANCHGQSVSALARQYRGLNAAAGALGYSSVSALQNAIMAFCGE
jgi:YVTN family beta-propeller protein